MSTYVIGDIHGCFRTFRALLEKLAFDSGEDYLWLVGDLVNGGLNSLEVLRWVSEHEQRVTCVLGNHDVYALARYWGVVEPKKDDTLQALCSAPDAGVLMDWLRRQPLIHLNGDDLLVHAGLSSLWTVAQAMELAHEVEARLRGPEAIAFLRDYFASPKRGWTRKVGGQDGVVRALRVLTMLRTCRSSGKPCFEFTGPPEAAPAGCVPWYQFRPRTDPTFYFGHWAALGYRELPGAFGLDSGCIWGKSLTARRLEDGRVIRVRSRE